MLLAVLALALLAPATPAQTKLLRFPDVHGDKVAFCYAGDLWVAASSGGTAARLTAHPGLELFPKFSPDGAWIAFTGQYDGDEQVYVMPSSGGVPKQLTFYPARGPLPQRWGYDNQVYGWTRDGKAILFRSMRDGWDLTDTRLFTVPIEGGLPTPLAMPVSGGGDLSPDGQRAVYSPLTRDFRSWKRYQGGWAQDLYIFDLKTAKLEPVANHPRTERDPMWIGNKIYFVSDRDGTLNLFEWDIEKKSTTQLTTNKEWDVRWASRGEDGEIVYELDGELHIFDTQAKSDRKLQIKVPDDGVSSRPARVSAQGDIESFSLSPKGERALVVARGDVFTLPIEKGSVRNLTHSSNAHDRVAEWSPDGTRVAYISDASGEEEIWVVAQDGATPPRRLTTYSTMRKDSLRWSPDSKSIAYEDKSGRLFHLGVDSLVSTLVARDRGGNVSDYTWSPDSGWLAFSLADETGFRSLYVWNVAEKALTRVTGELFNESEPVWDPSGDFLWYLSDREFAPQLMGLEWNFAVNRTTCIYGLALRRDVKHPFAPESDEVTVQKAEGEKDADKQAADAKQDGAKKDDAPKPVAIDLEGLAERVVRVPVEPDNYNGLSANKDTLFYTKSGAFYYGRESESKTVLMAFSKKDRKASVLVDDCSGYELSADGSKILARSGRSFGLYDASSKGKDSKKDVSTADLYVERVPKEEWRVAFFEVWRRFRDYFYAPNMHGYDWDLLRQQYEPLLEHVGHRADLNYVISEMIAELNVGHAYVTGGDWDAPARPQVALFGGRVTFDPAVKRFQLTRILRGQNEEDRYRSPLTEVGVDAKVGDWLLAIDGVELQPNDDPYRLLRHKADRAIEFTLNANPTMDGARKVVFKPISSEADLFYLEFVLANRERVDKLSNGRLAYIHIPDMGADGIREFIKWYYGQTRKEGLIVDDRNNGGGNVSQMLIERLRRVVLATDFSRNSDFTGTYPQVVFHGPMACLINENSASDGDIFPWMFQNAGLGPVIGKRSWGGVVGITNHGPLIDGGTVNVPEFGHADANGQWAVEGHGVDPDIVVDNDATSVVAGRDPQLERAVQEVLKAVETRKQKLPGRPSDPVKTR
ncbi:MAG: PD40 domain-containing protein [Planctomycetes bacterium]|nr:PD40 domain-containing protein [Planctomycetota bacterium]